MREQEQQIREDLKKEKGTVGAAWVRIKESLR